MIGLSRPAISSKDAMQVLRSGSNSSAIASAIRKHLRKNVSPTLAELRRQNYWTASKQIGSFGSLVREYYKALHVKLLKLSK